MADSRYSSGAHLEMMFRIRNVEFGLEKRNSRCMIHDAVAETGNLKLEAGDCKNDRMRNGKTEFVESRLDSLGPS